MSTELPQFSHVLETILYTKDIEKSREFYTDVLKLKPIIQSARSIGFELGQSQLLIFALGLTLEDVVADPSKPSYRIARHGPSEHIIDVLMDESKKPVGATSNSLRQHYCLAVESKAEVEQWYQHLQDNGIHILGKMNWKRGGYSFYFEDPDAHVGEIASRGIWPSY